MLHGYTMMHGRQNIKFIVEMYGFPRCIRRLAILTLVFVTLVHLFRHIRNITSHRALCPGLFIYCLFKDAVTLLHAVTWNERMII